MKNFSELALLTDYFKDKNDGILIDVGAHEGGVTARFANRNWKVLAFEPEEINRNEFLKRHGLNNKVTCIPKAVTDTSGDKIPFYVSDTHYGIHSIMPFHDTHQNAPYEVETITLKDALQQYKINYVDFLKVDTEGADFLALKGFEWTRIHPEIVMVEFMDERSNRNFGYTHHDMADYMKDRGYACFVSEWAPIKSYGIKGEIGDPHTWLQCSPYPLDHPPAWGNLIFVPSDLQNKFKRIFKSYIVCLEMKQKLRSLKRILLKIKKKNILFL